MRPVCEVAAEAKKKGLFESDVADGARVVFAAQQRCGGGVHLGVSAASAVNLHIEVIAFQRGEYDIQGGSICYVDIPVAFIVEFHNDFVCAGGGCYGGVCEVVANCELSCQRGVGAGEHYAVHTVAGVAYLGLKGEFEQGAEVAQPEIDIFRTRRHGDVRGHIGFPFQFVVYCGVYYLSVGQMHGEALDGGEIGRQHSVVRSRQSVWIYGPIVVEAVSSVGVQIAAVIVGYDAVVFYQVYCNVCSVDVESVVEMPYDIEGSVGVDVVGNLGDAGGCRYMTHQALYTIKVFLLKFRFCARGENYHHGK